MIFSTTPHLIHRRKDPAVVFADAVDFGHLPRCIVRKAQLLVPALKGGERDSET